MVMVFQKKKKQYKKIIVLLLLCSLNIEFPDRSAFFASYNILTSHVSGYCSLFSYLYISKCNCYCCQLPDDCFVRSMILRVADKCV